MKIAIQGTNSSFHAIAARALFSDDIEFEECLAFKDVFAAIENGTVEYGVVAIENSLYGSINDTYDLLVKHDFHIHAETYEHISLHLLGVRSASLSTITDVYSHPAALGESIDFLDQNLPQAQRHEYSDTALSADFVAKNNDISKASIAGDAAAKAHGLQYLAKNIETHHANYTRFIAISKQVNIIPPTDRIKSSIVFQTPDKPGSLYAALGIFAERNINLTKLESRPIIGKAWRYMYYIDIESDCNDDLLSALKPYAHNIRVLGVYENNTHIPD